MKIFCTDHHLIAGFASPDLISVDTVYLRPDSSLIKSGKHLYIPEYITALEMMPQLMVRISRVGKCIAQRFAQRYYDEATIAITTCDCRQVQRSIRLGQMPHIYRDFDGSIAFGRFFEYPLPSLDQEMTLTVNHESAQQLPLPNRTIIDEYISLLSRYYMLKMGDFILLPLLPTYIPVYLGDNIHISGAGSEVITYLGLR